jgi:hypothetical protein
VTLTFQGTQPESSTLHSPFATDCRIPARRSNLRAIRICSFQIRRQIPAKRKPRGSLAWRRKTIGPRSATSEGSPSRNPSGVITTTRQRRVLNGIGTEKRSASCKPSAARVSSAARSRAALAASDQPQVSRAQQNTRKQPPVRCLPLAQPPGGTAGDRQRDGIDRIDDKYAGSHHRRTRAYSKFEFGEHKRLAFAVRRPFEQGFPAGRRKWNARTHRSESRSAA